MLLTIRKFIANTICPEIETERRALSRLVNTDVLTGLGSRRAFDLASGSATCDAQTSFIIFDVNNFKKVNDIKGHKSGDDVLRCVAEALTNAARRFGIATRCFRIGGDEFAILAPASVAGSLRALAELEFGQMPIGEFTVSISGGIGADFESADLDAYRRKAERKSKDV